MDQHVKLYDFLSELIDVQIKKYVKLAGFGIGPDARLNAALVYEEVYELLGLATQLLEEIESNKKSDVPNNTAFLSVINQVKFYIEQEKARAYAGWLLDSNNIHATVDNRTSEQVEDLKKIAESAINFSVKSKPVTAIQRQCQHDSCEIAFYILKLAKDIKANPTMKFDEKIPAHAQVILRKNASTRYQQYSKEIDDLCQEYELLLQNSSLKKRNSILTKTDAETHAMTHTTMLSKLLERYKQINPASRLFCEKHQWHKVAATLIEARGPKPVFSTGNLMFFGGLALGLGGGLLLCGLLPYLTQFQQEEDLLSTLTRILL